MNHEKKSPVSMSDAELLQSIDELAKMVHFNYDSLVAELRDRRSAALSSRLAWVSAIVCVATVVNVGVSILNLLTG